jgi:hypothetical protein
MRCKDHNKTVPDDTSLNKAATPGFPLSIAIGANCDKIKNLATKFRKWRF